MSRTRLLLWLMPAIAAGVLWVLVLLLPAPALLLMIGGEERLNSQGEARNLYNLLGWGVPETYGQRQARRAGQAASFIIPLAFRLDDELHLTLEACGCGIGGEVLLTINETTLSFPLSDDWRVHRFVLPHQQSIHGDDLYLVWRSEGSLGPLVGRVAVQAAQPDSGTFGALWLGAVVAASLLAGRGQPAEALLLWAAVLIGSAAAGRALYQVHLLPWPALLVLGGTAAVLLGALVPLLWHRLLLWAAVLWLLAAPQMLGTWILDDAFISFRYAANFIHGFGLTFNPGEVVEGYTNFLWTLLLAALMALGAEPVLTAQILCTALALAVLLLSYRAALDWWPGSAWALLPPLLLALNPAFLLYTARGSGMEPALITLLALVALWLLWRAQTVQTGCAAGLACALVVMTRPDGALVPLAGGLLLLAQAGIQRQRQALLTLAGLVGGFVLLYSPYFAWRFSYYGYLLPNTFYAKTGATMAQAARGFDYTRDFLLLLGGFGLAIPLLFSLARLLSVAGPIAGRRLAPLAAFSAAADERRAAGRAALLWLFVLLTATYVTLIGGDHFPLGRFFVPALPALAMLITHGAIVLWRLRPGAGRVPRRLPPSLAGLVLAGLALHWLLQLPASDSRTAGNAVWREHKVALKNAEYGYWLHDNTPADAIVATGIAGALPYYAERYVIDTLGLNDVYIAHLDVETMGQGVAGAEKTDINYVLDRRPDYIPFSTSGEFLPVERFEREYRLIEVAGPRGGTLQFFVRRDR